MAEQKQTRFALAAVGFAEVFNVVIGKGSVSGHRIELSAPDGLSTGGGAQSVQHIKLIPSDGGSVIVAGSADPVGRSAELRSFAYLGALHAQRYKGAPLALDPAEYAALLKQMQKFFA